MRLAVLLTTSCDVPNERTTWFEVASQPPLRLLGLVSSFFIFLPSESLSLQYPLGIRCGLECGARRTQGNGPKDRGPSKGHRAPIGRVFATAAGGNDDVEHAGRVGHH